MAAAQRVRAGALTLIALLSVACGDDSGGADASGGTAQATGGATTGSGGGGGASAGGSSASGGAPAGGSPSGGAATGGGDGGDASGGDASGGGGTGPAGGDATGGGDASGGSDTPDPADNPLDYLWQYVGAGTGAEQLADVAVTSEGDVYVLGTTQGGSASLGQPGFLGGPASFSYTGLNSAFLTKVDQDGLVLWVAPIRTMAPTSQLVLAGLVVDDDGRVVVAGSFKGAVDFDPRDFEQASHFSSVDSTAWTAFVVRYETDHESEDFLAVSDLAIVPGISGTATLANSIASDPEGGYVVGGTFTAASVDFNVDGGDPATLSNAGTSSGYVLGLDAELGFTGVLGFSAATSQAIDLSSVDVDGSGRVVVGGTFQGANVDLDPSGATLSRSSASDGVDDGFAARVAMALTASPELDWARTYSTGGATSGADRVTDVLVDDDGNVYVAGLLQNNGDVVDVDFSDSPPGAASERLACGPVLSFLTRVAADGSHDWVVPLPAKAAQTSSGASRIARDVSDRLYVAGTYQGTWDFDWGPGEDSRSSVSGTVVTDRDGYVVRLTSSGAYDRAWTFGAAGDSNDVSLRGLWLDEENDLYLAGGFRGGPYDLDPDTPVRNLTTASYDAVLLHLGDSGYGP